MNAVSSGSHAARILQQLRPGLWHQGRQQQEKVQAGTRSTRSRRQSTPTSRGLSFIIGLLPLQSGILRKDRPGPAANLAC